MYRGLKNLDPLTLTPKQRLFMRNHHQRAILMNDIMIRAKPSAGVRLNDPVKLRAQMAISDLRYKEVMNTSKSGKGIGNSKDPVVFT